MKKNWVSASLHRKVTKPFNEESLGCKPFQEKIFEIEILTSSDSVFSPDSEYGFEMS